MSTYFLVNLKDASMSFNTVSALEKLVYMEGFHHRMSKNKEASLSMSSLLNLLQLSPNTGRNVGSTSF
jgi:hypothetical protein